MAPRNAPRTLEGIAGRADTTPMHVGLIPDGVRRWADKVGVTYDVAYPSAMEKIEEMTNHIFSKEVRILSVYVLSKENLIRGERTLAAILDAEILFFETLLPRIAERWSCRILHAGVEDPLPREYVDSLRHLCKLTRHHSARKIYLCACYNPIDEVMFAVRRAGSPAQFAGHLWVVEPIDMLIRTGMHRRLSYFLPIQAGYAELYFLDELFPEVTTNAIDACFQEFACSKRNFGR